MGNPVQSAMMKIFLLGAAGLLLFSVTAGHSAAEEAMTPDEREIRQLNDQYIEAFMKANVNWYREHLAEDFVCIESSGTVLGKQAFLRDAALGPNVAEYKLDQVRVRIYGNVALVQATGLFQRKDGTRGKSRYTDIYVRNSKEWKAVSAQITRVAEPVK